MLQQQKKRCKTVEFIVEESDWKPGACQRWAESLVHVRVAWPAGERRQVKGVGGKWHPQQRVWELRYDRVSALGLEERIVGDNESI